MSIRRGRFGVFVVSLAAFGAALATLTNLQQANAHSWYPQRCCGGNDCQKVDRIEFLPGGEMLMHAGRMKVLVPRYFVRELSEDGDAHVCAVSIVEGKYEPVCVFMPGTT